MQKLGVSPNVEFKLLIIALDGFDGGLDGCLLVRNNGALGLFEGKVFFEQVSCQLFFFLFAGLSRLFCLIDFIARTGQASTQMLQVLPTHFSLSN